MRAKNVAGATSEELVQLFLRFAVEKGQAVRGCDAAGATQLYWRLETVERELQSRPGDDRRLLKPFYDHVDPSVRLEASKATLAIFPLQAHQTLQNIYDWKEYPFTLYAGSMLRGLQSGAYKPT